MTDPLKTIPRNVERFVEFLTHPFLYAGMGAAAALLTYFVGGFHPHLYVPAKEAFAGNERLFHSDIVIYIIMTVVNGSLGYLTGKLVSPGTDWFYTRRLVKLFSAFFWFLCLQSALSVTTFFWPAYGMAAVGRAVGDMIGTLLVAFLLLMLPTFRQLPGRIQLLDANREKDSLIKELKELQATLDERVIERTRKFNEINRNLLLRNASLAKLISELDEITAIAQNDPNYITLQEVSRKLRDMLAE